MHSLFLKKSLYVGSYVLTALLIEFITFNAMGIGVFPTYFWLDIAILFFVAAIIFIVPSFRAQTVLIMIMLVVQVLVSIVNHSLYGMSNMVFSLSMLNLLNEVGGVFTNEFLDYLFIVGLIFVFIAECFVLAKLKKLKAKQSFRLQTIVMLVLIFCLTSGVSSNLYYIALDSFATVSPSDELYIYKDDSYLYDTQFISAKAYKKFGTFGFYYKNIANFVKVDPSMTEEEKEADLQENLSTLDEYFADGEWSSSLTPLEGYEENVMTGKFEGQNVVLIVIESGEWYAINREYTPTLYALASQGIAMTNYYARDKTNHSEAMSILGSYPSQADNSIAPTLTDPDGLLSNDFAFSLPNILQESGYTTNYFHANTGSYYAREDTFAEPYGFDNAHFLDTMNRLSGYYSKNGFYDLDRDSEVISQYLSEFEMQSTEDEAFFTMMMTITSHGHYNDLIEHGDYTADLSDEQKAKRSSDYTTKGLEPYYERINGFPSTYIDDKFAIQADDSDSDVYLRYKRFQAGMMDLDVGVNRLISDLQSKGELDNTTFVFYADHNAYYTQQSYFIKDIPTNEYWNTAHYNIPFFIWSGNCMNLSVDGSLYSGMTYTNTDTDVASAYTGAYYYDISHTASENIGGVKIEKYCNSFDVLPTILDLLGYDYNLNLYHGVSVFKEETSVFISREAGMFNDYIYSDGDRVFVKAAEGGSASTDGEIVFSDGSVFVQIDGQSVQFDADDVENFIYLSDSGDWIIFDLDAIFRDAEQNSEPQEYLSDGVNAFLKKTSAYYDKQDYIEIMYRYNYFAYRDIGGLIKKSA